MTYGLHIAGTTVDSDDEFYIFFREFIEKIIFESISIMYAVWESVGYLATDLSEVSDEDSSRADSIDIVVTEDDDAFIFYSCFEYAIHGLIHIWEEVGIMER